MLSLRQGVQLRLGLDSSSSELQMPGYIDEDIIIRAEGRQMRTVSKNGFPHQKSIISLRRFVPYIHPLIMHISIYQMNNQEEDKQIEKDWLCPITQELMKDPVIAADGFTYERAAIEKWLSKSNHSPMTGAALTNINIIPNLALRNTIQSFLQNKQGVGAQQKAKPKKQPHKRGIPNITLKTDSIVQDGSYYVKCSVVPPEMKPEDKGTHHPCSIICILDISESMNTDSILGGKDVESHGFSRLDLVKHSINTMIEFMGDDDEMAVIPFSNAAKIVVPLMRTSKPNKIIIRKAVKDLYGNGSTNIWDGLKTSLDLLKMSLKKNEGRNVFVVLLTDGEPNLNPPRGIVPTLKKFIDIEKLPTPNIHVFGYGYELDTGLLAEIAQTGYGTYTYIPDCSMVGTVFVNFMASALAAVTNRLKLRILNSHTEADIKEIIGLKKNNNDKQYNLGVLQYGQDREFFLKYDEKVAMGGIAQLCEICISFDVGMQELTFPISIQQTQHEINMKDSLLRMEYLRLLQFLSTQRKQKLKECYEKVDAFYKKVEDALLAEETPLRKALAKELKNETSENEGQVSKAFEKEEWFDKWGKHYIPSLYLAHMMQACTNFKDPALQLYGGEAFEDNRNNMDTIFIKMAPPEPSAKKVEKLVYVAPPVDMGGYYNEWGGCIHEDCLVQLATGMKKKVRDLQKGDKLLGGGVLRCLVKTNVFNTIQMIVVSDNLIITPWHPIKMKDGVWRFPAELSSAKAVDMFIESYYNFVLEDEETGQKIHPSLICEGVECIALGHGLTDNEVVSHEYFGSKVIQDLQQSPAWQSGLVTVKDQIRDPISRKIIGLNFTEIEGGAQTI